MPLAYLLDEHLRGPLWWAIQRYNARSGDAIDSVRVGDHDGPPFGISDTEMLAWAEQTARILITLDEQTTATVPSIICAVATESPERRLAARPSLTRRPNITAINELSSAQ